MNTPRKANRVKLSRKLSNAEHGFSLLELVVAVGVILILVIIGLLSYSGITNSAKQAAVNNAASEVFTSVLARSSGAVANKDPLKAGEEWMASAGDKNLITVEVLPLSGGNYKVQAYYDSDSFENSKFTAVKKSGSTDSDTDNPNDTENPGGTIGDNPLLSSFTFMCDETSTGFLPISNIDMNSTKVMLIENNGTSEPVEYSTNLSGKAYLGAGIGPSFALRNVSSQIQMKAGIEYKVQIEGTYEALAHIYTENNSISDCLKSINSLGNDSGLRSINQLSSRQDITGPISFPNSIPSTVESLAFAFVGRTINDAESIGKWNTNSLQNTYGAFRGANVKGSLDLSKWNMSNVSEAGLMFADATIEGDLNLSNWTAPGFISPIINGTTAETINLDSWRLNNSTIKTVLIINNTIEKSHISMNNWTINNSSFQTVLLSTARIDSMNNWTITNQDFNSPLFVGVTINGNMNDWTIQNVNNPSFVFEYTGTTVNGSRTGWTLDGSPM